LGSSLQWGQCDFQESVLLGVQLQRLLAVLGVALTSRQPCSVFVKSPHASDDEAAPFDDLAICAQGAIRQARFGACSSYYSAADAASSIRIHT